MLWQYGRHVEYVADLVEAMGDQRQDRQKAAQYHQRKDRGDIQPPKNTQGNRRDLNYIANHQEQEDPILLQQRGQGSLREICQQQQLALLRSYLLQVSIYLSILISPCRSSAVLQAFAAISNGIPLQNYQYCRTKSR
jgi:hypothetical protein